MYFIRQKYFDIITEKGIIYLLRKKRKKYLNRYVDEFQRYFYFQS
jgi:hypothetical protein